MTAAEEDLLLLLADAQTSDGLLVAGRGPAWAPRPGHTRYPGGVEGYRAVVSLPMAGYARSVPNAARRSAPGDGCA